MKCLYCQNDCEFVELEDLMAKTAEVWKCTKCPHPVRFNKFIKSDRVAMICISMKMHDETYAVHIYHEAGPFEITKYFQIGKVGLKRNMKDRRASCRVRV